jgi:hypothetical protein
MYIEFLISVSLSLEVNTVTSSRPLKNNILNQCKNVAKFSEIIWQICYFLSYIESEL